MGHENDRLAGGFVFCFDLGGTAIINRGIDRFWTTALQFFQVSFVDGKFAVGGIADFLGGLGFFRRWLLCEFLERGRLARSSRFQHSRLKSLPALPNPASLWR